MISGIVTDRHAIVSLTFLFVNGSTFPIEFVIDTGFTDHLCLPPEAVNLLRLPFLYDIPVNLADNSEVSLAAHVQVTVAVGIEEDSVAGISRARNLSKAVPDYALKNLEGDWQEIEKFLPESYRANIIFKPNEFEDDIDKNPNYTVVDLVQRLALINNELFDFRKDNHPTSAYSGKGSLVTKWDN